MAKKVKIKKRNVGIAVGFLVVIIIAIAGIFKWKAKLEYQSTDEYKLLEIGYTEEETKFLIENLKEEDLNKIIENKTLDDNIIKLLNEKYFMYRHLDDYLTFISNNPDKSLTDVVALVNVGADKKWYEGIKSSDTSKGVQLLVNKFYALDSSYEGNLTYIKNWYAYDSAKKMDDEAYHSFISMYNAASEDGFNLVINSSYRSYEEQQITYDDYRSRYGSEYADEYAARAGHSEHQTGLAIDIAIDSGYTIDDWDTSPKYKWLQENAYEYGFILRYPKGKEYITGYNYESWHYRYVGIDVATYIHENNITFDEYYAYFIEG